jgi:hypothetical protein
MRIITIAILAFLAIVCAYDVDPWWAEAAEARAKEAEHVAAMKRFLAIATNRPNGSDRLSNRLLRKCFKIGDNAAKYEAILATAAEIRGDINGEATYCWKFASEGAHYYVQIGIRTEKGESKRVIINSRTDWVDS